MNFTDFSTLENEKQRLLKKYSCETMEELISVLEKKLEMLDLNTELRVSSNHQNDGSSVGSSSNDEN
jgi:hypothetical protein